MRRYGQVSHASRVHQLVSASILYSGATPRKVPRLMSHMRVACMSDWTSYTLELHFTWTNSLCKISLAYKLMIPYDPYLAEYPGLSARPPPMESEVL